MSTRLTFVHALSPLHAGIGQGIGIIDLPVAREKATGLPFLPGSSLKGTLRGLCPEEDKRKRIFGLETTEVDPNTNYASSVQFSDQRILLLPVRSLAGAFAWVTSPYILRRLLRDIQDTQVTEPTDIIPDIQSLEQCIVATSSSKIMISGNKVYLEDLDLQAMNDDHVAKWTNWIGQQIFPEDTTWQQMLTDRFCVVHDDILNFLFETATEVIARIKLQENSKTVQSGGLWYEEALPTESVMWGLLMTTPIRATDQEIFSTVRELTNKTIQLGGKATVGRGMCRVYLGKEGEHNYANS